MSSSKCQSIGVSQADNRLHQRRTLAQASVTANRQGTSKALQRDGQDPRPRANVIPAGLYSGGGRGVSLTPCFGLMSSLISCPTCRALANQYLPNRRVIAAPD